MPNKSYRNAIKEAIELEMRRDPSVIVVGEDVRGGHGGKNTDDNTPTLAIVTDIKYLELHILYFNKSYI